jgi:RNA-directed DNA polymerase
MVEDGVIGDEPETPDKIRTLQRKLYGKAKAEPAFRFYLLYDKICRRTFSPCLCAGPRQRGRAGCGRGDVRAIEAAGWRGGWRPARGTRLEDVPAAPVRRVMIPKPGGGERPLGIPTIRDRVVQTAAKLVLEPIFEADFEDGCLWLSSRSQRGRRGQGSAPADSAGATPMSSTPICRNTSTRFRTRTSLNRWRRIVDRHVLRLIKLWLKAPIEERDGDGKRRMSGGKQQHAARRKAA